MRVLGVDPGMVETGIGLVEKGRVRAFGRIKGAQGASKDPDVAAKGALSVAKQLAIEAYNLEPDKIVVEEFKDQGGARKLYRHRWLTPMVIGAMYSQLAASGFGDLVEWQDNIILHQGHGARYIDLKPQMCSSGLPAIGLTKKVNDHVADAILHALAWEAAHGR